MKAPALLLEQLRADARLAAGAIARGDVTSVALADACLARAAAVEPKVRAFARLDADDVRRRAAAIDARRAAKASLGALGGVPVAIKDIIDVAGVPTECGSSLYRGRVAAAHAEVVRALEAAGGVVFGKTVTAELAFYHPGPTRNPYDLERTPGGSSMGSAAAVAAGVVPLAVGTQTNGSVIRPAAFCGVVGVKPTSGRLPRGGIMPFAPTLDQVGGFARTVESAALLAAALAGEPLERWWDGPLASPRLAVAPTSDWERAEPVARARFEADVAALAAGGARVERPRLPPGLDDALPVHRTIMSAEGYASLGRDVFARPDDVSRVLRDLLEEGARTPRERLAEALRERERLAAAFASWAAEYDAILTLPAVGEAPSRDTTGDPRFCTRWTLVGAPCVTLPTGLGPHGLPLGLQLVGAQGADRRLLAAAAWVERHLPPPPAPSL